MVYGLVVSLLLISSVTAAQTYLTPELVAAIDGKRLGIKFMPYDWTLNEMEEAIP